MAESAQASDTTSFLIGATSLSLAQRLYTEARTTKQCDLVKEMQQALVDAQISLPKGGRAYPDQTPKLLASLAQTVAYGDQLAKAVCR